MSVQKRTNPQSHSAQPDWNDLRFALELGRHGTLSGAARALRVNHATVARRIAALEATLGVTLFERGPRGYQPTAAAGPVMAAAEQVEAPLLQLGRQSEARRGFEVAGKIRITATEGVASHMVAPGLAALRQRWPLLEVEIVVEHRSLSLARREAEIAIRWARPTKGELFTTRLGPVPYRLYRHPRAVDQTAVAALDESLADLPESHWLGRQPGLRQVIRSNSMLPLITAARTGACAILLPEFVGRHIPELVADSGKPPVTRELWLLLHRDLRKSPRVRVTADFLIAGIRKMLRGG